MDEEGMFPIQDSDLVKLLDELGITDEDWYPQQPEPTSDCSELDHYGALYTLGECPSCFQKEVLSP